MPRNATLDFYQNYPFHLFDLSAPMGLASAFGGSLSSAGDILALTPQLGFSDISTPAYEVESEEVKPGNDPYPKTFVRSVSVDTVTLSRGVRLGDLEFYRWTMRSVFGRGKYRRTLGLVQFHGMLPMVGRGTGDSAHGRFISGSLLALAAFAAAGGASSADSATAGAEQQAAETIAGGATALATGAGANIPGARAWILYDCVPVRYDPAEADLGADDDDVTIMELELQPERFFEYSIPPGAAKFMGFA